MGRIKCRCKLDQDGQCQSCRKIISDALTSFTKLTNEFNRKMDELKSQYMQGYQSIGKAAARSETGSCSLCGMRYADLFVAKVIASCLSTFHPSLARKTYREIKRQISGIIPRWKTPLSTRAWKRLESSWTKK